jgi:ApaG protein
MKKPFVESQSSKGPTPFVTSTQGITIEVWPRFDRSTQRGEKIQFIYSYNIEIHNRGKDVVQLISRHWIIQDGLGNREEVVGEGVVGEKPILGPGESFEYFSFCPLETPSGSMKGTYTFKSSDGSLFEAAIDEFVLKTESLLN